VALGRTSLIWLMSALAFSLVVSYGTAMVWGLRITWPYLVAPDRVRRSHKLALEAVPAIVITVMIMLACQSGRWYLAQNASGEALASYALALQIWTPLISIAYALGVTFWPAYRQDPDNRAVLWSRNLRLCALVGAAVTVADLVALPIAFRFVARGTLAVPWTAGVLLALTVGVWILHQASSNLFSSPEGLRRQAAWATAMALVNGAILLAFVDVAGPLVAAFALLVSMTGCALLPFYLAARRALATEVPGR
jgi:hypothetical protein